MANFKNRLKENWKKNKIFWIFTLVGILVIAFYPLSSYFFSKERGLTYSLLVFSLWGVSLGFWMLYFALRHKKVLTPDIGGGKIISKKEKPVTYYFSLLFYIGLIVIFIFSLIISIYRF